MLPKDEIQNAIHKADNLTANYEDLALRYALRLGAGEDSLLVDNSISDAELASKAYHKLANASSCFPTELFEVSSELLSCQLFDKWVQVFNQLAYSDLQAAWISTITHPSSITILVDKLPDNRPKYYLALLLNQWFDSTLWNRSRELSENNSPANRLDKLITTIAEKFLEKIGTSSLAIFLYAKDRTFPVETPYSHAYYEFLNLAKSVLYQNPYVPVVEDINSSSLYSLLTIADVYLKTNKNPDITLLKEIEENAFRKLGKNIMLNLDRPTLLQMSVLSNILYKSKSIDLEKLEITIKKNRVLFEGWRVPGTAELFEKAKKEAYIFCALILILEQDEIHSEVTKSEEIFSTILKLLMVQINTCDNEYFIDKCYFYPLLLIGYICEKYLPSMNDYYLSILSSSVMSDKTRQKILQNLNI